MICRECLPDRYPLLSRPLVVLRRNLTGHINAFGTRSNHLSHQFLAVAISVRQGGVDEVQPKIDRLIQRFDRLIVLSANPHPLSDPPGAVPDFRNLQSCPAKCPVVHRTYSYNNITKVTKLQLQSGEIRRCHSVLWTNRPPSLSYGAW